MTTGCSSACTNSVDTTRDSTWTVSSSWHCIGERQAERLYADVVCRLGVAIANLVNLLSPRLVILGGEASLVSERLLSDLREPIDAHVFGGLSGSFALEIDDWRGDRTAWARGAASLAMEHVFDPLLRSPGVAIA